MTNPDFDIDAADVHAPATVTQPGETLKDDLIELARLRKLDLTMSPEAKQAHADYKAKRQQVYERMETEGEASRKLPGIGHFIRNEPTWKPIVQDKKAAIRWAQEHQPALVEQALNKGLLNQLVHERMRDGRELPPGIGAYPEFTVSIRKA